MTLGKHAQKCWGCIDILSWNFIQIPILLPEEEGL